MKPADRASPEQPDPETAQPTGTGDSTVPVDRTIHFAQRPAWVGVAKKGDKAGQIHGAAMVFNVYAVIAAFVMLGMVGAFVIRVFRLHPVAWIVLGVVAATLGAVLLAPSLARWWKRRLGPGELPQHARAGERLTCIAHPDQAAAMRDVRDEVFEPEVAGGLCAFEVGRGMVSGRAIAVHTLCFTVVLLAAWQAAGRHVAGFGWLIIVTGMTLGAAANSLLWPVYYRASPGTLDVLEGGFMGRRLHVTRRFDLTRARVVVNMKQWTVVVEQPAGTVLVLSLVPWLGARDFPRAVLNGAITTEPGPPLPDDALVG